MIFFLKKQYELVWKEEGGIEVNLSQLIFLKQLAIWVLIFSNPTTRLCRIYFLARK
eukprot:SAG31_NODE_5485_length_2513_cov_1.662386_2_plen_56_part_00